MAERRTASQAGLYSQREMQEISDVELEASRLEREEESVRLLEQMIVFFFSNSRTNVRSIF